MRDFAVHEEPAAIQPRGLRRVLRPVRRLLVLVLRPVFRRLSALLEHMDADQRRLKKQHDCMGRQLDALLNRGWDHAALLRRLALLEHQVEELEQQVLAASLGQSLSAHSTKAG